MLKCMRCEKHGLKCDGGHGCQACRDEGRYRCVYIGADKTRYISIVCQQNEPRIVPDTGADGYNPDDTGCTTCKKLGRSCEVRSGEPPCMRCVKASSIDRCVFFPKPSVMESIQTRFYMVKQDESGREIVARHPELEPEPSIPGNKTKSEEHLVDSKAQCSTPGCVRMRQYGPLCTTCRRREYEARRNNPDKPKCINPGCERPRGLARHQLCYPCYFELHHQGSKGESTERPKCSTPGCEHPRLKTKTTCGECHARALREHPKCSNVGCNRNRPPGGSFAVCIHCRNKAAQNRECASSGCANNAPKNGLGGIFCIDCALEHGLLVEKKDFQGGSNAEEAFERAPWWKKELERRRKKVPTETDGAQPGVFTPPDSEAQGPRAGKRQKRVRNDAPCIACRQSKRKCEILPGKDICTRCARQGIECCPFGAERPSRSYLADIAAKRNATDSPRSSASSPPNMQQEASFVVPLRHGKESTTTTTMPQSSVAEFRLDAGYRPSSSHGQMQTETVNVQASVATADEEDKEEYETMETDSESIFSAAETPASVAGSASQDDEKDVTMADVGHATSNSRRTSSSHRQPIPVRSDVTAGSKSTETTVNEKLKLSFLINT